MYTSTMNGCKSCGKPITGPPSRPNRPQNKVFCNLACQADYRYKVHIDEWKSGRRSGLNTLGNVTAAVKRYLREKFDDKCVLCGWCEVNPVTGKIPLVADHIDGNWRNNVEENLRLICPNCDSLSSTYKALNRGQGRSAPRRSVL